ncbi:hypothetical protein F5X96DRAFT_538939 [Biscogniauxia mediterranea]|nr:hypothetical protein F5X96DRAFT_538939 [Biscogniauxia mediterranea]
MRTHQPVGQTTQRPQRNPIVACRRKRFFLRANDKRCCQGYATMVAGRCSTIYTKSDASFRFVLPHLKGTACWHPNVASDQESRFALSRPSSVFSVSLSTPPVDTPELKANNDAARPEIQECLSDGRYRGANANNTGCRCANYTRGVKDERRRRRSGSRDATVLRKCKLVLPLGLSNSCNGGYVRKEFETDWKTSKPQLIKI